ncbi:Vegetative incompatibility protein HET-E-1, partial [Tolypocladium ophioglossoides CBS 100239]
VFAHNGSSCLSRKATDFSPAYTSTRPLKSREPCDPNSTMSSAARNKSLQHRLRERLNRLRGKSRDPPRDAETHSTASSLAEPSTFAANLDSSSKHATSSVSSISLNQTRDASEEPTTTRNDATQSRVDKGAVLPVAYASGLEKDSSIDDSTLGLGIEVAIVSSDLWSAAYREAVDSLGKDINAAILKGDNVAELFKQLEKIDKEATQESAFLRGVRYLHSLQVPLERFKLALDLATPLTNIEPTSATVFGVVKSVTAIAISFSTADLEFAKRIGEMLEQLSYIDDCDTLGQKTNKIDIHKALVLVYQKLLEFFNAAFEILSRKGAKLVMKMVLENDRLPKIVEDFLKHADDLRKLVQKATWEIVEDIKAMLYDHEIARWLGIGKMSRQSQHHAYLQQIRVDKACEFLLVNAKFINWHQATDSQQLVVLGDMGCGKTVAMAFLIDELRRRNEHQLPQPRICYHYCRNDETGQAVYIFSSLILSLLEQFSGLKRAFFEWYKQVTASGIDPAASFKKLEEWLQKTLGELDRPLFLVIDGLDECDRASRSSLLKSLKNLSQNTSRLKILLSSRPQEEILEQLTGMAKIDLDSDAKRDRLIVEKTVERQLSYLSEDVKPLVTETLSRSAQGSAIWTKMTVDLIEKRGIRALAPMRAFLKEIPQPRQLSELYVNLLSRYTSDDPENQRLATTALEILATTRRPLSILELAWAVAMGVAQEGVLTLDALAKLVDHQRVMSLIQPFVAHVDFNDLRKRQVRLVHQSVQEFIVREWASNRPAQESSAISTLATDHTPVQRRAVNLEAGILDVCIRYLLLDDIGYIDLFSEEHLAIEELPQGLDLFDNDVPNDYDPYCTWEAWEENMIRYDPIERGFGELFVYASCHWIDHFGAISVEPLLPGLGNIGSLCQAGSTRLHNWIKQNCRPDCTIKPRFIFDSTLYDPLSVASLYGSETMLRIMLESSDFDSDKFLPNPAIGAADQILQWGDLPRLKLLMGSKIGHQIRNLDFFRLVMNQWSNSLSDKYRQGWDVVFDLIDDVLDMMVRQRWGNELVCRAASTGCVPIIRRLMDRAQHNAELRAELLDGSRPEHRLIGEAIFGNHVDVVEYLLEQQGIEAHLQHRNSRSENVLHLASRLCNPAMFQHLVPRFKDGVHQTDDQNDTVLMRIVMSPSGSRNRLESARILLSEGGVNEDGRFKDELQETLWVAERLGDLDMCGLLIRIGKMNPPSARTRDDDQMVSKDQTSENEQNTLAILKLLRTHADTGSTPAE